MVACNCYLIIDVNGSFRGSDGVTPLRPARLFETRAGAATVDNRYAGTGARSAGSVTEVKVGGRGGVSTTAAAVSLNVTAINPTDHGYATVYPCDAPLPNASNLNYKPGETRPNAVITKLSSSGSVCVYTSGSTDLVIDVNAAFGDTSGMAPIVPVRLLDSRPEARFAAESITRVPIAGRAGGITAAQAVSLNVTAHDPTDFGFVTVFPCGEPVPNASNLNFRPGETSPNAVIARLGQAGDVCIFSSAATHLLVDVNATFANG